MIDLVLALAGGELVGRLGGPLGERARQAARALAGGSRTERAAVLAAAVAPVPAGLRGVHASWLDAALAELPPRARAALAAGGGTPIDEHGEAMGGGGHAGFAGGAGRQVPRGIDVWLARWACAELPPLPPLTDVRSPRSFDELVAMASPAPWLVAVGRGQLAYAAQLARPGAPRRDELGPARAVIARCRGGDPLAIAARALAPYADPLSARQLAVRLPRPEGLLVLGELRAHAADPAEHAPRWSALP